MSPIQRTITLGIIIIAAASTSGCVVVAAAAGGYVAADEINEGDGKFDPFEKVLGEVYGDAERDEDDDDGELLGGPKGRR